MNKLEQDHFDLISLGLCSLLIIFTLIRYPYMPQFVDAYYHLSTANGFLHSGGWTGWSWWDMAPAGRPQVYPPLYHFILVLLQKCGLTGLNALRLCEVSVPSLFFFLFWYVVRRLTGSVCAFFALLLSAGFFSFYTSTSIHIPATLALCFGLMAWHNTFRFRWLKGALFLALCFYTHSGIPWIISGSLLFLLPFREYRKTVLRIIIFAFVSAFPFLFHQFRYLSHISFNYLREVYFVHFSPVLIFFTFRAVPGGREKDPVRSLFLGYCAASLAVFCRYPYRFFSAQGILGPVLLVSLFFSQYLGPALPKIKKIMAAVIFLFFFFFHSTVDLDLGKPELNIVNSTFSNFLLGRTQQLLEFRSLYVPAHLNPVFDYVKKYTKKDEIIASNSPVIAQMLTAFTGRPNSSAMLGEVSSGLESGTRYVQAKVIVWAKPADKTLHRLAEKFSWQKTGETDIALIYFSPYTEARACPGPAAVPFWAFFSLLALIFALLFRPERGERKISR